MDHSGSSGGGPLEQTYMATEQPSERIQKNKSRISHLLQDHLFELYPGERLAFEVELEFWWHFRVGVGIASPARAKSSNISG